MIYALIVLGLAVLFGIFLYNRLITLRKAWTRASADIEVQLKQRHDLIPNLVETVKGYAAHESGVFVQVTQARTAAMRATNLAEKGAAEAALTDALGNLFAVAENYPQLRASENFQSLQSELSDLENKIASARRFMNSAAAEYNSAIQQFPAVLVAGPLGFHAVPMFELDGAERVETRNAPQVSFSR